MYEVFEHTADVGLRARAGDLNGLFAEAGRGLFSLLVENLDVVRPGVWREFIYPVLKRMYGLVRRAGKFVFIHSCGDVDELFDELIEAGVNCFNPFQPEVMDVYDLLRRYRGRLAFHGGLSTQRTLPRGSVEDVKAQTRRLLEAGAEGGYIFSPAHAVEGDVPIENMLAFLDVVKGQRGVE